jgi:chromate reductase
MAENRRVAVLVGSLRRGSLTRKVAEAVGELAPAHLSFFDVGIDLPLYNQDVQDAGAPESWTAFRQAVRGADAILFATPEYNRGIPGGLKNALDVGSRPIDQNVFKGKPGAVMSVSPGGIGGFGANHHLRQSLVFLDVLTLQQPEAYVGGAANLFDDNGKLTNDGTRKFLTTFAQAFADWIEKAR